MSAKPPKYLNNRALTHRLNEIGLQIHTVDDEGNPVTKEQAMAEMLWKMALGYVEKTRDDDGNLIETYHPPVKWAIELVYDRKEGKAAPAVGGEDNTRVKAADRVRELAKERLNRIAVGATDVESTEHE